MAGERGWSRVGDQGRAVRGEEKALSCLWAKINFRSTLNEKVLATSLEHKVYDVTCILNKYSGSSIDYKAVSHLEWSGLTASSQRHFCLEKLFAYLF